MHMNKVERIKALFAGKELDKVPAGFWFHYPGSFSAEEMAAAHLELYRKADGDIIKLMQDYLFEVEGQVKKVSDWYHIRMPGKDSAVYRKIETVIKLVREQAGDEVMMFQTIFGPFKSASFAFGDDLLMAHSKEAPEAVAAGVNVIAEALAECADGYLEAGADGIYYTAQFGEVGRFSDEQWRQLVCPSDLKVLGVAAGRKDKYNILHICGEPEYDFKVHLERFADYPGDIVNWSVKDNGVTLEQGKQLFKRPILGGLNNKGNILNGSDEDIIREVRQTIDGFGTAGLMIGADCTIQGDGISIQRIGTAIKAAHDYE